MAEARRVVIVGGGPAGLTGACALMKAGVPSVVLEKEAQVGGHARTVERDGFLFDVGGHRFFTKIPEVSQIWREVLDDRFLRVRRLSRILYRGRFFHYPLKPLEALWRMGLFESGWVALSYVRKKIFPMAEDGTLESWMSNRFGRRLFMIFSLIYFADGADDGRCGDESVLANTTPGSRRVSICRRFARAYRQDRIWTEVVVIHEALHTLGLGENPPTSFEISTRVASRCRH